MSEPIICVYCGDPIPDGDGRRAISTGLRHARPDKCVYVLKSRMRVLKEALESASADRDRYRAVLVELRDAERAYARARSAEDAAYRATCGASGDALNHAMLDLCEASGSCDAAGDAASAAIAAAIAAVEEGR